MHGSCEAKAGIEIEELEEDGLLRGRVTGRGMGMGGWRDRTDRLGLAAGGGGVEPYVTMQAAAMRENSDGGQGIQRLMWKDWNHR